MSTRDKAAKFVELGTKRVNKAIKDIRLIGNLANKKNYEYTDEQARRIIKALQKEIDSVKQNFQDADGAGQDEFQL